MSATWCQHRKGNETLEWVLILCISWMKTCFDFGVLAEFELLSDSRLIEADAKSLNSLSGNSGHSRKSSDTSQISLTSGKQVFVKWLKLLYCVCVCVCIYVVFLMICVMIPGTSSSQERTEDGEEDTWTLWGRVSNDWDNYCKKRNSFVRVRCSMIVVAVYSCVVFK